MNLRNFFPLLIILIVLTSGCTERKSSTTQYIKVLDKEIVHDEYLITAVNPYSSNSNSETTKIDLLSENTWNLVEIGKVYVVSFSSSLKNPNKGKIESINHSSTKKE